MKNPIIRTSLDLLEDSFDYQELLDSNYFKKYRKGYEFKKEAGGKIGARNYITLLTYLKEIAEYNKTHANSYAKRFKEKQNAEDYWRGCESIFCEIIIYQYYIRLVHESLISSIKLEKKEADIIIEKLDKSKVYLEAFCVMPNLDNNPDENGITVHNVQTHSQKAFSSIRQKLLKKIEKNQLSKVRENYAVIELNDPIIAGDFSVNSSLSSGYKVTVDTKNMEVISEGYDWKNSIFDDESTKFLKGIIYFNLGDYSSRKFIYNPKFSL